MAIGEGGASKGAVAMRGPGQTALFLSLLGAVQLGSLARAHAEDADAPRDLSLQAAFGYGVQDDEDAGSYGTALGPRRAGSA